MRQLLTVLLGLLLLVLRPNAPASYAQSEAGVERLEIALWPEYDQRAMLVIYRFQLAPGAGLPTLVRMPIPAAVGEPHAVATRDPDGRLVLADYTREVEGAWAMLLIESESPEGQIEYYSDLTIEGQVRSYRFTWPGGVALGHAAYEVQAPVGVSGVTISPAPEGQTIGPEGLVIYQADLGPQAVDSTFTIDLTYTKTTPQLSVEVVPTPTPSQPIFGQPEVPRRGTPDLQSLLPWLVGGFGVLLLVAGSVAYVRLSRRPASSRRRSRHPAARRPGESGGEVDASPAFCHNCGTRADPSDSFCRRCGTRLRT